MDTSKEYIKMCEKADKEYIKMCEKAVEIQDSWNPDNGDFMCLIENGANHPTGFWPGWLNLGGNRQGLCDTHCRRCWDEYGDGGDKPTGYIWLPRQDQLQEMVKDDCISIYHLAYSFSEFLHPFLHNETVRRDGGHWAVLAEMVEASGYKFQFTSMEQLWLAFVMKEKYQKVWDNGWIEYGKEQVKEPENLEIKFTIPKDYYYSPESVRISHDIISHKYIAEIWIRDTEGYWSLTLQEYDDITLRLIGG